MKIGVAFSESIRTEKTRRKHFDEDGPPIAKMRLKALLLTLFVVGGILFYQLFKLQILKGEYYRNLSDSNRTRTTLVYAPRGVIFDRNNIPLTYNIPGFRQIKKDKTRLLTRDKALDLIAKDDRSIFVDSLRQYPLKEAAAHVIGYIGQITPEQMKDKNFSEYQITDLIGKSGIEDQYESLLKGINGKELIEVDATGKKIRTLGFTDPVPGQDITLTIDSRLQLAAYGAMKDVPRGAVVVSTPDGQILALLSKPSFDPNLFTLDESYKAATDTAYPSVASVLTGANQPLLDRAIGGTYPPGSTYKIVMAAGALESKKIDEDYTVNDKGIIRIGPYSYSNWYFSQYGRTEGEVDVVKALARSNDIFFYELAAKIGLKTIVATSSQMGVGKRLGIDLPGEASGVLPDEAWKKKNVGEDWYLGDTYIYGIGQGYLLTTPLQVNFWTGVIANGGRLYRPRMLKSSPSEVITKTFLSPDSLDLVRTGMIKACETGGTAYPFFDFKVNNKDLIVDGRNITETIVSTSSASAASGSANLKNMRHVVVACKTGTAEHGGKDTKPHAWITLFAPAYDPEIVVTVLAEEIGEGSSVAGPIAKKILESYFEQKRN